MAQLEPYEKLLVDYDFIDEDVHGQISCEVCHGGDPTTADMEATHKGVVKDPTFPDATKACGSCHLDEEGHPEIAAMNPNNLHVNLNPFKNKIFMRSDPQHHEAVTAAMGTHCMTCHSSCGQCHVSRPNSVEGGLIDGHLFQKTPPVETNCTSCHGSRVGKEFHGKNEGFEADLHHREQRMACKACHDADEMHGADGDYFDRYEVPNRARCEKCHPTVQEFSEMEEELAKGKPLEHPSHAIHRDKVSCQVCHSLQYKNCYSCHVGKDKVGVPYFKTEPSTMDFKIGLNPNPTEERPHEFVTVRHIPVSPGLFDYYLKDAMTNVTAAPTWKLATPHNIQLKTPQNAECLACHDNHRLFLSEADTTGWEIEANQPVFVPLKPPLHQRHAWLNQSRLHLAKVDCLICHDTALAEPLNDCSQCHTPQSILLTEVAPAPHYSLSNWSFTNSELIAKGMYVAGSTRIPGLDMVAILIVILTFAGCTVHGTLRFICRRRNRDDD